jgi:hypothetical protein
LSILQIVECGVEQDVLPGKDLDSLKDIQGDGVRRLLGSSKDTLRGNRVNVFVASLYASEYVALLERLLVDGNKETGFDVHIKYVSSESEQKYADLEHFQRALVDMYLLSFCDAIISTRRSTFGKSPSNLLEGLSHQSKLLLSYANLMYKPRLAFESLMHIPHS